jgi:hypothetical protein
MARSPDREKKSARDHVRNPGSEHGLDQSDLHRNAVGALLRTRSSSGRLRPTGTSPEVVNRLPTGFHWFAKSTLLLVHGRGVSSRDQTSVSLASTDLAIKQKERENQPTSHRQFVGSSLASKVLRMRLGRGDLGPSESNELVADPGGLFVVFQGHGQLELLLQPFQGTSGAVALDVAFPAK